MNDRAEKIRAQIEDRVKRLAEREHLSKARVEAVELCLQALAEDGEWPPGAPADVEIDCPECPEPADPKKVSDHVLCRLYAECGTFGHLDDDVTRLIPVLIGEALAPQEE